MSYVRPHEDCDCLSCLERRAEAQSRQDRGLYELGWYLSMAKREHDEEYEVMLAENVNKALSNWPLLPVRVQ